MGGPIARVSRRMRFGRSSPRCLPWLVMGLLVACCWWPIEAADSADPRPVTRIADVRFSSRDDLAGNPPVRLRAIVTRATQSSLFVQDETGGIYVNIARALIRGVMPRGKPRPDVPLGSEVELDGVADPGGYSPIILPRSITVLGPGLLPPPRPFDPVGFFSGDDDSQFVEVPGIVQDAVKVGDHWRLALETIGRPFLVSLTTPAFAGDPRSLIDAEVIVRGPTSSMANTRGEFLMPWVFVERPDWLEVVKPAPASVADCPVVRLGQLASFRPGLRSGHRVRTSGTVIHVAADEEVYLQEGCTGIRVTTRDTTGVEPGDRVEVIGFPVPESHVAGMAHATLLRLASGPPPEPVAITPEEITAVNEQAVATSLNATPGDYSGCLVRFPAKLADRHAKGPTSLLVLSTQTASVVARCDGDAAQLTELATGSLVEVTGIVSIEWQLDPLDWPRRRPRTISLLLRSPGDIRLLQPPPFWTLRRLATVLAVNATALGLVAVWAWSLRRRRGELEMLVTARTRELAAAREHEKQIEEQARHTLEKKLRSSLSAAAIAHEINQPLSRILLRCRLSQADSTMPVKADARAADLRAVAADAEQVVTTIEKMNVLLRNVQTTHTEVDLAQVARSSGLHVRQFLEEDAVRLRMTLPPDGCPISGDEVQLQLAIVNLLRNATEAIAAGDGACREIELAVVDRGDVAMVVVGDSGPGWPGGTVAEALLATTKSSGTGVGLFVVSTAVENHGGSIEVGTAPLGGAEFRLLFPRAKITDRPRPVGPGDSGG